MKKGMIFILLVPVLLNVTCKKVPFYASEGASLTISSDKNYLKTGGEKAVIRIIGFNAEGEALHDHTLVVFNTTLGTIEPVEIELIDGKGAVEFYSNERSGLAQITARSGTIVAEPNPLEISIGSVVLESLTISVNPASFEYGGGRSTIRVYAFDVNNNLLPDIPVVLSTSNGYFSKGGGLYITNDQGMVEDYLYITESATVKAESGDKNAEIEIKVKDEEENQLPTAGFSYSPSSPKKDEIVYFNGSISTDSDGYIVSWEWDFGDGKTRFGKKVQHTYTWTDTGDKSFEVVLIVKDNRGGTDYTTKTITVYDNI